MYIVFCSDISDMGKKFEVHSEGVKEMGLYIALLLRLLPKAEIKVRMHI